MLDAKGACIFLALVITSTGYAVCPTPLESGAAYPKGATVYYTLDSSLSQGNAMEQHPQPAAQFIQPFHCAPPLAWLHS